MQVVRNKDKYCNYVLKRYVLFVSTLNVPVLINIMYAISY